MQVAGDQGVDVALHLDGFAHIGADDAHQALVEGALPDQRQQRDEQALVVDLPPVRRLPEPADIDHMGGAGEQRDQPPLVEGGEVMTMS